MTEKEKKQKKYLIIILVIIGILVLTGRMKDPMLMGYNYHGKSTKVEKVSTDVAVKEKSEKVKDAFEIAKEKVMETTKDAVVDSVVPEETREAAEEYEKVMNLWANLH